MIVASNTPVSFSRKYLCSSSHRNLGPEKWIRKPPRDHKRNFTMRSRKTKLFAASRWPSGKIVVSKWKTDPSACSRANLTGTEFLVARASAKNFRLARAAGRKDGSSGGARRGATRHEESRFIGGDYLDFCPTRSQSH